jgi:excisionase family DNA binding protein
MSDADELLTIEQAAGFLNVSEASLRRWTNSGQLACLRVGRRRERRFRRADLLAFMEEQPARVATGPKEVSVARRRHTLIAGLELAHGTHLCGIYGSDSGRAELAAAFLAGGFSPGSICFLVTPPSVRNGILMSLEESRPSLRGDIDAGRLVLSEHAASAQAQLDRLATLFLEASRAGAHSLRVVGDMWGMAKSASPEALMEFEAAYDEHISHRFPVVALCQYDARRFSGLAILDALKQHKDTFRYPADRVLA